MNKSILLILILLLGTSVLTYPIFGVKEPFSPITSGANDSWHSTNPVPSSGVYSCVDSLGYIFCVGGTNHDLTYYAIEGSSGVGTWSSGNPYPVTDLTKPPACAAYSGYIYCTGGVSAGSSGPVYSASISPRGFSTWSAQNRYPIPVYDNSCVTYSGYIYCIAGENDGRAISSTYFASISSGEVGTWSPTSPYPDAEFETTCAVLSHKIYCAEGHGQESNQALPHSTEAILSSSGISSWAQFSILPSAVFRGSCVAVSSFSAIYCVGGKNVVNANNVQNGTFFTTASTYPDWQTSIPWNAVPFAPNMEGCVSDGINIFCVGGYTGFANDQFTTTTDAVEYTSVFQSTSTMTWKEQSSLPFVNGFGTGMVQSCQWANDYIYCVQANGATYYASAVNGVVGSWIPSTSYPISFNVWPPSCVVDSSDSYFYCVGGSNAGNPGTPSNAVYSAPISTSGFGRWTKQGNYPLNILFPVCVQYSGNAYCVGGSQTFTGSEFGNTAFTANTYVASLSSGALGTWNPGVSYPISVFGQGCALVGSNLYCIGGESGNFVVQMAVYTTTLSTSPPYFTGWTQETTNFPLRQHVFSCVNSMGRVFCLGGNLLGSNNGNLFASSLVFTTTDFNAWTRQTELPYSTKFKAPNECIADNNSYIYCVGGEQWDNDSTSNPLSYYYTNQVVSAFSGLPTSTSTSDISSSIATNSNSSLSVTRFHQFTLASFLGPTIAAVVAAIGLVAIGWFVRKRS
jgi:hypothetical protein